MKNLAPMKRAERVDSWTTALLILMFVHTGVGALRLALEGTLSLLCGVLVAAGYILGRRWLRRHRGEGHAAVAWTMLRIFETACVTLMVFLLCTVIGTIVRIDVLGYVIGVLVSLGFVGYRVATWGRQYIKVELTWGRQDQ